MGDLVCQDGGRLFWLKYQTQMECDFSFHLLSTASMARCFFHSARVFPDFPFSVNAWLVVRVVGLL